MWDRLKRWWAQAVQSWSRPPEVYDEMADVRALHVKYGILASSQPGHLSARKAKERTDFLQEELNELRDAFERQDLADIADALVDLVYVAKGTAVMLGLPWDEHWEEVQRANMMKVRGVGKRGHAVDLVKPPEWLPPQHDIILDRHGYDRSWWYFQGTVCAANFIARRARDDDQERS